MPLGMTFAEEVEEFGPEPCRGCEDGSHDKCPTCGECAPDGLTEFYDAETGTTIDVCGSCA